jgi:N-acetylglucosamine kinase-like BadF-type ATPase
MNIVLGIDGGGTRTRAAILADDRRVLGQGEAGPSNIDDVGEETARANIGLAVAAARGQARVGPTPFAAAFLGMAGVTSDHDRAVIRRIATMLALAPEARIGVDHDCRIALAGGLSGRPGIVLITGTGSSCYGRTADGAHWLTGGRGHLISDEGSGYWYGLNAIRAAVRHYDGRGPATRLHDQVLAALGIASIDEVMHRLYVVGASRAEIAALAPLVIAAAEAGDGVAQALFEQGSRELVACVVAAAERLDLTAGPSELALCGGLAQAAVARQPLIAELARRLPACRAALAEQPPVIGAALLALAEAQRAR